MPFFLIFALQCLFPIFDIQRADEFLGLSIVNRDTQAREFTITATAADGGTIQSGRVSIPAGAQRALLINEILEAVRPPLSGWLRVDSAAGGCSSYLTAGNRDKLEGADAAETTSNTILIPNVTILTGFVEWNHVDTWLAMVNPNTSAAIVTAQLFGLDGAMRGSISISVPARGSRSQALSEAFRDTLPDSGAGGKVFDGYVRLASSVPIAAWQRIETPQSRGLVRGRTLEEIRPTTLAVVPHFATGGMYQSILNVVNPTSAPLTLDLTALDDQGNAIGESARRTLAPGQALRSLVAELFRIVTVLSFPPPLVSGYIRIREAEGRSFQAVGDIEISSIGLSTRGSSMHYPIGDTSANSWLIPFAINSESYFTGYSVVTPNELLAVQTDVQLEVLDSSGTAVEKTTISLSPRRRRAALVSAGIKMGYLRFTSNLPIHVLGSIGSGDGHHLDQLPALK